MWRQICVTLNLFPEKLSVWEGPSPARGWFEGVAGENSLGEAAALLMEVAVCLFAAIPKRRR